MAYTFKMEEKNLFPLTKEALINEGFIIATDSIRNDVLVITTPSDVTAEPAPNPYTGTTYLIRDGKHYGFTHECGLLEANGLVELYLT